MPSLPSADEVQMQRHIRAWSQRGGSRPDNSVAFMGANEQYMIFGDQSDPVRGGIEPVRWHDPLQRESFRLLGRSLKMPNLPSGQISFLRRHGGISWLVGDLTCAHTFFEHVGDCGEPTSFTYGWNDEVVVYSGALADDRSYKNRSSQTDDNVVMDDIKFTYNQIYSIGSLGFGEQAQAFVEREAVDLAYQNKLGCGNCGVSNDGTKRLYVLTKSSGAGSPGTPAEVIWTTDGGVTYNNQNITGLSGTSDPTAIDTVGDFVVVLDTNGNGYYWAAINPLTGTPGTWTNVIAGFVASKNPTDLLVVSASEVYITGRGGYIYKMTDPTQGVSVVYAGDATSANLLRIDGTGDTLVAVGESGVILKSLNRGRTWALATTSPTSGTLRAVQVMDDFIYWIGSGTGGFWYTLDGGESFVAQTLPSLQVVDDIVAATAEVIWVIGRAPNSSTARLYTTYNGGRDWSDSSVSGNPRILAPFPTFQRGNRLAVPETLLGSVSANRLAIAGLGVGGTDGVLYVGSVNTK